MVLKFENKKPINQINMENTKYLGRGIHKDTFRDALTLDSGKLKPMLEVICNEKKQIRCSNT